ncbi:MAG: glycosyltransferase [Kaistella sp.]|nr:glycosyltransferase [Kaistella sp.]
MIVSVIMVTYGHEKYIEEAINGVFIQQTDFPVELIIANDCSPDQTDKVVKSLLPKSPENVTVKYTKHEFNKGANNNFNWAASQATGKYIALCEGDDYWTDPLKLQKQVHFLEGNKEYVLVGHKSKLVGVENQKLESFLELQTQSLLFRNVIRDDFYNDFPKIVNADTFMLLYLENFGKFKLLDFFGSVYRLTGSGVWTSLSDEEKKITSVRSYKQMLIFFNKYGYKKSYKKVKCWLYDVELYKFLNAGRFSTTTFTYLLIKALGLADIKRVKSVIVSLPLIKKILQ